MKKEVYEQSRCPKCCGNLFLDKDHYGWYEHCLQCGYVRNMEKIPETWKRKGIPVNTGQFKEFVKVRG